MEVPSNFQFTPSPLTLPFPIIPPWKRSRLAIAGFGESGRSVLKLLLGLQMPKSQIAIWDQNPSIGEWTNPQDLLVQFAPEVLVVSPGVPIESIWIQEAKAKNPNLRITSELEIAFFCLQQLQGTLDLQFQDPKGFQSSQSLGDHPFHREQIIGITGSVGKSTTISLLGEGARTLDPQVFVGGNLGTPLATYVYEVVFGGRPRAQWVLLELSSFQMECFSNGVLDLSLLTGLTPNHLERYRDLDHYYRTKWDFLLHYTRGPIILNARGGDLVSWIRKQESQGQRSLESEFQKDTSPLLWTSREDPLLKPFDLKKDCHLIGDYNQDNLAMATRASLELGWPKESILAMKKFPGLPHRMENIGVHDGIVYINDSKATTMESVLQAVESLLGPERVKDSAGKGHYLADQGSCLEGIHGEEAHLGRKKNHLFLLLGGKDKNLPWEYLNKLAPLCPDSLTCLFFGASAAQAQRLSGLPGSQFHRLVEALESLKHLKLKEGDQVLLSPGGASQDEFRNFEERGQIFKTWVLKQNS